MTVSTKISKTSNSKPLSIEKGSAHPLGATVRADGVNFSLFSENATGVELLLFDDHDDVEPFPDDLTQSDG
jgi:isoamylase